MKKIFIFNLVIIISIIYLAGNPLWKQQGECLPLALANQKINITFSYGHDPTGYNERMVREFEKQNPDIKVKIIELPSSVDIQHSKYATTLGAGDESVDVFAVDIIWTPEFASAGWILPLDKYFHPEVQKAYLKGPMEAVKYKGRIYAVPWYCNAGMIFYRKDLLKKEKLNPPDTWKELVDTAKLLEKKYQISGFVWQAYRYEGLVCNFLEYLWGNNAEVFDKDGKIVLDSKGAQEALEFMKDLIHTYKISPVAVTSYQEQDSLIAFIQGKSAFLRSWPYVYQIAMYGKESKIKGNVGIIPIVGKKTKAFGTLGTWNLAVSKFSKHPDEAWKLVKFLTGYYAQKQMVLESGLNPSLKAVYFDKEVINKAPHLKIFLKIFEEGKPRPVSPLYPKISIILQRQVHRAITGEIEPGQALVESSWRIKEVYKKYGKYLNI